MKYALILFIIITQIVLVIVAAYFIFRVYSCVFTISAAFAQLCALQVCAFTSEYLKSHPDLQPQFTNSSKWSGAGFIDAHLISISSSSKTHPWLAEVPGKLRMNMWKETWRCYSIFRCSWNVQNIRESHQQPTHRLCTSRGAINFKLLKISKIIWE